MPPRSTLLDAVAPLLPLYSLDVLTAFTIGMVPPLLPLLAEEWALSTVEVGLINAIYAVGRLATSYPASWIRAHWGTRAVVFLGLAVLSAGLVASGLAPTFAIFLAGRLLMGVGASATVLAVFAEFLESAPPAWRGRLTNGFEGLAIMSMAAGGVLAATLTRFAGWRGVFVGAAPVLLLTLITWRSLGPLAGRNGTASAEGGGRVQRGAPQRFLPVYVASLTLAMTWTGLFSTLVPILGHGGYGLSSEAIGFALGLGYLAELVGLVCVGLVIDRVPREPVFLGGALAVTAGGLLLAVGTHPGWFVVGLLLLGGGFAVWMIPAMVLVDRGSTALLPGQLARYRIAVDMGMIVGPLLLGGVAGLAGDRLAVGAAGFVLIGGALALTRR